MVRVEQDNNFGERLQGNIGYITHLSSDSSVTFFSILQGYIFIFIYGLEMTRSRKRIKKIATYKLRRSKFRLIMEGDPSNPHFHMLKGFASKMSVMDMVKVRNAMYRPRFSVYQALIPCRAAQSSELIAVICFDSCTEFMIFLFPNSVQKIIVSNVFALHCIN